MKKSFFLIPIICSILVHSCSDKKSKDHDTLVQNQTPEVLDNSKPDISSISKRYASDIVQDLFNEAILKNPQLKDLTNRMNELDESKNDSLKPFREYFQNNDMYWKSTNNYINQLSDSMIKNDLREIFKIMETKYRTSISNHNYIIENLENKAEVLDDCEILMKLTISAQMISNYQKNELPALNGLNSLVGSYDTIIKETKEYSKIVK